MSLFNSVLDIFRTFDSETPKRDNSDGVSVENEINEVIIELS